MATALLGTEQRQCAVVSPEIEFLSAWTPLDPAKEHEAWLLLASAYAAAYHRAGQVPPIMQPAIALPPAPAENKRYCSPPVASRIANLLAEVQMRALLLHEFLILLAAKKRIVPPELLPDLLTWGQRSKKRRALIVPVVGERGQWLAACNPEWKNALQVDPKDAAEQAKEARLMSGQQALYEALNITDNIFNQSFSVLKGQGFSGHGRMLQLVMEKLLALSKTSGNHFNEQEIVKIVVAVLPAALPELIRRIQEVLASEENHWLSRLLEQLDFRQQMLEELDNE